MGRYFALTIGIGSQMQTKTKTKRLPASRTRFGLWLVVLILVVGGVYLVQVNSSATKGYEIKKLERQLMDFKETAKRLELEAASLQSIQNIETTAQTLNLIPSQGLKYFGSTGYAYDN